MKKAGLLYVAAIAVCMYTGMSAGDSAVVTEIGAPSQKFFEVLIGPTKVLKEVNPQSPILGLANKNDIYPLVYIGTTWSRVVYKNDTGWIDASRGRVTDTPTDARGNIPAIIVYVFIGVCISLIALLGVFFIISSTKRQKFRKVSLKRDVLIISPVEKEIHYSLTNTSTSLSKCFSEIGFKVSTAHDLDHARILLVHYAPDVLVVDWRLERNIQPTIQSLLSIKGAEISIIVIFFNVPDPAEMEKRNTTPTLHYVGPVFSDRDIFKFVTPLLIEQKGSRAFKKSVQSAALEGEIGSGNLVEVMQFIEIGRKTGCLFIALRNPIGLIYFEAGRIIYAATRAAAGREAVYEILNFKEGRFRFAIDKTTAKKNANLSTLEVLMDWTKGNDEAHRH
jgi:hypothetical protein